MASTIASNNSIQKEETNGVTSLSDERTSNSSTPIDSTIPQVDLELENVTYSPVAATATSGKRTDNRKTVLSNISTRIAPKRLTAWMGPSGSGKTSLISVAAGLIDNQTGDLSSDSIIRVNGQEGKLPKRLVGVVWQDDLLLSNLTVEETIYFSARLKTPKTIGNDQVEITVEETMKDLGLLHVRHSLVGNPIVSGQVRGISGGERKRVSVASELVVRPPLLLLDEPTSGLDATTSLALIQTLKRLSNRGHSIAVVIHQPRTSIYNLFDHVLLLSRGHMVYDGPPCQARAFLESCPLVRDLPPETGIADWMMDMIIEDEKRINNIDNNMSSLYLEEGGGDGPVLRRHWRQSGGKVKTMNSGCNEQAVNKDDPSDAESSKRPSLAELKRIPRFETTFWTQLKLLIHRTLKQQRGERLTRVAALITFAYTLFTGLLWFQIPRDSNGIFQRISVLFFMIITQSNQVVLGSMMIFQRERSLLHRERAKKLYRVSPYVIAKTMSDLTNNVLFPCLYGIITYWAVGLRPSASHFFLFVLIFYLTVSTAQSMGLFLSVVIPNPQVALAIAPTLTLLFMILAGFYVPLSSMHPGIEWCSWLSFARYGYTALVLTEFSGRDIACADSSVAISIGGAGGVDNNGGEACPLSGDSVIFSLGMEGISSNVWFNVGMLLILQAFFRLSTYYFLRRSK